MMNLIPIPKFIPNNVNLTPYISPTITNTSHSNVESTPNTAGQTYNTNIVKVNSDATSEGGIEFHFENLEVGDFIELSCEVRVVSGDIPVAKIGEYNKSTRVEYYPYKKKPSVAGEWITINLKAPALIHSGTFNHRAFIGLELGKSGYFEVRGVRAIAYSKTNAPKPIKKEYIVKLIKSGGTFAIQTSASDSGITLTKPQTYLFQVDFPKTDSSPIVLIQSNKSKQYIVESSSPSTTTLNFSLATIAGTTVGDIDTTLPNDAVINILIKWI
jgi:hypothetical protein